MKYLIFLFAFAFFSCSSYKVSPANIHDDSWKHEDSVEFVEQNNESYSLHNVIVSLKQDVTDEDIDKLAQNFNLSVIYRMKTLNMCVLSSEKECTPNELDELIAKISEQEIVLSAMKDEILKLD